jgi:hypothetical protein
MHRSFLHALGLSTFARFGIMFNADTGAGSGAAGGSSGGDSGGGSSAGGQQSPTGGQAQGAGGGASPYRPEGLPDHLVGASERETIDKLFGAYKPAREAIGKFGELGELPADPTAYKFEPSEALKPYSEHLATDPAFKMVQDAAHKAGIRDKQFAPFISGVMEAMIEGGLVEPPVDVAKERAALVPADAANLDDAGKAAAVDKRVRTNHALIDVWKGRGLDEDAATALSSMLDSAAANRAIEFFAAQLKTEQPALGGGHAGAVTEASLEARTRDPRNRHGSPQYDAAFAAETTRQFQQFYK